MNRIFLRFFVVVMLSVTAATIAIYFAISYLFGDPLEEIARKQSAAQIFLLEQYVDKAPADEWLVRLNKVRAVSDINLELIPLKTAQAILSPAKNAMLARGQVVIDVADRSFFRRVDLHGERYIGSEDDVIHVQGLPIDVGLALKMEMLRYVIVALSLLIPIALWSRAHWRGLQVLSRAADNFGEGKLATKIEMNRHAAMYPLAQGMNQMAQRIESLLDAHKNLLHSVSHELRTPIARLEFGLELLREESASDMPQTRIQAMAADLVELNALVDELLNLTKLDHQQHLRRTRFSVHDVLEDSVHAVAHSVEGKEMSSEFADDLGDLVADRRLIARALGNLLTNAAKYGNHLISLKAHRLGNGGLEVSVEDDGPGIPVNERQRVFEPFYRLDRSRDRGTGGFGLGLAIAQKALALHGGTIAVSDSTLGGAKFTLVLPGQNGI
jgi:two-component system OmpR family sensor kinase